MIVTSDGQGSFELGIMIGIGIINGITGGIVMDISGAGTGEEHQSLPDHDASHIKKRTLIAGYWLWARI